MPLVPWPVWPRRARVRVRVRWLTIWPLLLIGILTTINDAQINHSGRSRWTEMAPSVWAQNVEPGTVDPR